MVWIPTGSAGASWPTPGNAAVMAGTPSGPSSPPMRSSWSRTGSTCKPRPRSFTTAPPRSVSSTTPGSGRASGSSSWPRAAVSASCSYSSCTQPAGESSPRPAAGTSSRSSARWAPTWSSTTQSPTGPRGSARPPAGRDRTWCSTAAAGELGRAAFEITARGGRFSAHGGPSGAFTVIDPYEAERRRVTVRGIEQVQYSPAELQRMTERALSEAAEGRIKPVIGRTFPLEQAAIEARDVVGKTLLLTNGRAPNTAVFTDAGHAYLRAHHLGRLATIGPSG